MSMHDRKLRNTRRLIAGITLAFVVSFATAAMVVFLPESALQNAKGGSEYGMPAVNEYVAMHQARYTVAPSYMHVEVATTAK